MKSLFEKAQQFGKSFMLPIAILPAAGLLLGIGGALSNPNTVKAYPILDITLLQNIFTLMSAAGSIVFQNLPVIFAIGVAIGLSRSDKGTVGLAALLGFLIMNATMNGLLTITGTLAKINLHKMDKAWCSVYKRLKPVFWRDYHRYYDRNTSQQISQSGITTVFRFLWWL